MGAREHIIPRNGSELIYASNTDLDIDPKIYTKSNGCYVYDIEGNRYLDTFGSLLTTICGHNNDYIIDAITKQLEIFDFFPNFGDHFCLPMIELSKRLRKVLPEGLSAFFYVSSGSEANETALKAACRSRLYTGPRVLQPR